LGGMRAPMTSAKPLAGQVPAAQPVRTVRQPISQTGLPTPVRTVRQPLASPDLVPQEEQAMEEATEDIVENVEVETLEPEVSSIEEVVEESVLETVSVEEERITEVMEEVVEEAPTTMTRPTTLLKPIRGVLKPLEEGEEVKTASLTPVGHMLIPEKKRGPPPSSGIGKPTTTKLRPVKGTLKPVAKKPVTTLQPEDESESEPEA